MLPDGKPMFIGYAGKTGGTYASLGMGVRDAGLIPKDQPPSLTGIRVAYKKDPAKVQELIWRNENMVFFQVYEGDQWPSGSLGFKVSDRVSLATDKQVYPRGGVLMVDTTIPELSGKKVPFRSFMMDQDTGGAIRAPGRADIYMGVGPIAESLAGDEVADGTMYYLFLKPEFMSQYPMPGKKGGKDAAKAPAPKQQGLKPAGAGDANK
jgi:membrane-bound lytic murein transglycosylase A